MHRTQNLSAPTADPTDDPTVVVTPATILRGAATYLETHGWIRYLYYGGTAADAFPPACADGAIGMAAYGYCALVPSDNTNDPGFRDYRRAVETLTHYLTDLGSIDPGTDDTAGGVVDNLFAWNDEPGRHRLHVVIALRAAADDWDYTHATEADLETYAELCYGNEQVPDRKGFLAWLGAR